MSWPCSEGAWKTQSSGSLTSCRSHAHLPFAPDWTGTTLLKWTDIGFESLGRHERFLCSVKLREPEMGGARLGALAQRIERKFSKLLVGGSSPSCFAKGEGT